MSRLSRALAFIFALPCFIVPAAHASTSVFFDTLAGGATQFGNTVTGAGGTVFTDTLGGLTTGNSWARTDYTITSTNGASRNIYTGAALGGQGINMNASTTGTADTGLTFTFNTAVNAFSMQLRDWATCCTPSSLYISFDGGTPILVGTAATGTDNPGHATDNTYIGAIDDSGTFTTVTFYGQSTGSSDQLDGGGIISWARLAIGALSGGGYVNTATSGTNHSLAEFFHTNEATGARADLATLLDTYNPQQLDTALKSVFPTVAVVGAQVSHATSAQTTNILMDRAGTVLGSTLSGTRNFFQGGQFMALEPEGTGKTDAKIMAQHFTDNGTSGGSGAPLVAGLENAPYQQFKPGDYGVWIEGNSGSGQGERTANTLSYTSDNQGLVMGVESAINAKTLLGILYSPNQGQVKLADNAGKTNIDTQLAGIYAQRILNEGGLKLTGTFNIAESRYQNERNIPGSASALADYHGTTYTLAGGLSRLYKQSGWEVEPFTQAQVIYGLTDGFSETGAGALDMQSRRSSFSSAALSGGATLQKKWDGTGNATHTFRFRPSVRQSVQMDGADTSVSFLGSGSGNVVLPANSLTDTELDVRAEYQYNFNPSNAVKVGYDNTNGKTQHAQAVMLGYSARF